MESIADSWLTVVVYNECYGVLRMLAAVPNQQKAMTYVSNGYFIDVWPGSRINATDPFSLAEKTVTLERLRDEVAELTLEAKRAGVTIYGIDPRPCQGPHGSNRM